MLIACDIDPPDNVDNGDTNDGDNGDTNKSPDSAPTNVTTLVGDTQITLMWNAVAGASSYNIYRGRSADNLGAAPIASVNAPATSYNNIGLQNGIQYYYAISAVNAAGESMRRAEVSATPTATPTANPTATPESPVNIVATVGHNTVTLNWDAANGADVYQIYRGSPTDSVENFNLIHNFITSTTYTDTNVVNDTTYQYAISSRNIAGESARSAPISATPMLTAPVAPANVRAIINDNEVTITWDTVETAETYNIFRSLPPKAPNATPIATINAPTTSYTDTSVVNGTSYRYAVSATNRVGEGNQSIIDATPIPPVDDDNNGLIEIGTLEELNNMRYDLEGASYKTGATDTGNASGCPEGRCNGYELTGSLDFEDTGSYTDGVIDAALRPDGGDPAAAANSGWEPIGNCNTDADSSGLICGDEDDQFFSAIFDGRGFTIANLYSRSAYNGGLFGAIDSEAVIRNIGIVEGDIYGSDAVGGLAGINNGTIIASYAVNVRVHGSSKSVESIGGLVGVNRADSQIIASYTVGGDANGVSGVMNAVGGLVGRNALRHDSGQQPRRYYCQLFHFQRAGRRRAIRPCRRTSRRKWRLGDCQLRNRQCRWRRRDDGYCRQINRLSKRPIDC